MRGTPYWLHTDEVKQKSREGSYRRSLATMQKHPPTVTPTPLDIAWAAGIYEGEGSISKTSRCVGYGSGLVVAVAQKDPWILYRLRDMFGGRVAKYNCNVCHQWLLTGKWAQAFVELLMPQLSPRRQQQALAAIAARKV